QVLRFYNSSYWTIQNLRFDHCAISTTTPNAIYFEANQSVSTHVSGITIQNNTMNCIGGTDFSGGDGSGRALQNMGAIVLNASYSTPTRNISGLVTNNTIVGSIEAGIAVNGSGAPSGPSLTVSYNDISGIRCGTSAGYRNTIGIFLGGNDDGHVNNVTIDHNTIHDLQTDTDCYTQVTFNPKGLNGGGIYCDAG